MNSRQCVLQQETSDGRWLSDGMAERAVEVQTTTAGGGDLVGLMPKRVDSSTLAPYRTVLGMT